MRVLVLAVTLIAAGCSGGTATTSGRAVFDRACARCHTVTGHDTKASGGDLRAARLTAPDVASFARVMPVHPPLSSADARAVGRYVAR